MLCSTLCAGGRNQLPFCVLFCGNTVVTGVTVAGGVAARQRGGSPGVMPLGACRRANCVRLYAREGRCAGLVFLDWLAAVDAVYFVGA